MSLRHIQCVSETNYKDSINRRICLRHAPEKFMFSVQNLQVSDKNFSSFNFSLNYTFSWLLTETYLEPGQTYAMALSSRKCSIVNVEWVENRLLAKVLKILSSFLSPVFKLSQENTQPENMCDIVFEKTNDCGRTVRCRYMQKQPYEGFFKKVVMKSFVEFTRKHQCQNLFFW